MAPAVNFHKMLKYFLTVLTRVTKSVLIEVGYSFDKNIEMYICYVQIQLVHQQINERYGYSKV
jgi:hypothetical protein